jgi:hypothetical protein
MTKRDRENLKLLRWYKQETGTREVDMLELARWAVTKKRYPLPKPIDPLRVLAKQLSRSARVEVRHDPTTGDPYRANHAYRVQQGDQQLTFWVDIDEKPPRHVMLKSLVTRRDQMIGEAVQLTLDQGRWNRLNPDDEPIKLPMDFADDVEWRLNAPRDEEHKDAS